MLSVTGRLILAILRVAFSALRYQKSELRALGCRLEHVIFRFSGTSMQKMSTLKIARIYDR